MEEVPHVQYKSSSYFWVNKSHPSYDAEIHKKHPSIAQTCPYVEPLWSFVTLDFERGELAIEWRKSAWKGPSPWEIGIAENEFDHSHTLCGPQISDRQLKLTALSNATK